MDGHLLFNPTTKFAFKKLMKPMNVFIKIADYREIEVDIKFECECRENLEKTK